MDKKEAINILDKVLMLCEGLEKTHKHNNLGHVARENKERLKELKLSILLGKLNEFGY